MKRLIIMGVPHHGNVGDPMISVAQEQLIRKYFKDYELYMMPEYNLHKCVHRVKQIINEEDVILLQGGGNIGDIYKTPEEGRREVIKLFPNNKIIIFPQTAYFSDSEKGKKELGISKEIYNAHKNLVILAREEKTYKFMKENFYNAKIYLTPDIVMTLHKESNKNRKGALFILRTDREKSLNDADIDKIKIKIEKRFENYIISDMNIDDSVSSITEINREEIIEKKINEFQNAEIVITDRLHGMIFAAITETPCVVFGNFNYKISESYRWLKNLEYIQFCNDIGEIEQAIEKVTKAENRKYDNKFAEDAIVDILKKEI